MKVIIVKDLNITVTEKVSAESFVNPQLISEAGGKTLSETVTNVCDKNDEENKLVIETEKIAIKDNESSMSVVPNTMVVPEHPLLKELLDFLANSDAHFKSQQIGDPDLTFVQKRTIADEILKRNPGQFLARFGTHIKSDHLQYFESMRSDYEVDFYFKKLQRFHSKVLHEVDVKNRRYEALQKLISEGSYFSEEEMKSRNPLLYEQLIGQHMTEDERESKAKDLSKMTYVGYLLDRMDRDSMNELQQKQQDEEDGALEENDSDDESCDTDEEEMDRELSEKEKDVLRQEFVNSMYDSFLEGKDVEFDYSSVDFNAEYDSHKDMEQDDEEKYFDSETPESAEEEKNGDCDELLADDELDVFMKKLE